jgi:hypothetical protein
MKRRTDYAADVLDLDDVPGAGDGVPEDLDCGYHQDQAEDKEHPVEAGQGRSAEGNEDRTQDQRPTIP